VRVRLAYCRALVELASVRAWFDLLLRLLFFATAPRLLVFIAMLFPITGAVIQIGLALCGFLAGEAIRRATGGSERLRALLSSQLAFESYYREHPPRPFVYYVFYPLLLPYWLWDRDARREFLLYKGYTLLSLALMLVSLLVQYARAFQPELGPRDFAPLAAGALAVETLVVLMFLMPIVTSVVHFHRLHAPRRLSLLLIAGMISIASASVRLERRRDPIVSFATRVRVRLRSDARPAQAVAAETHALAAAWNVLPGELADVDSDGKVEGQPLMAAREALLELYKNDEANAFDLWYASQGASKLLVIYFESHRGHPPIWLARDETGATLADVARLPAGAFRAMRQAAR
jgi:hypothetical protein